MLGDVEVTLSLLTSRTKEWLWPPPSIWEGRRVWAGKIDGEFNSRNTAKHGSRVVEVDESKLKYQASGLALGC